MTHDSAVNLTLVLYPSSPRTLILNILQKKEETDADEINDNERVFQSPRQTQSEPDTQSGGGDSDDSEESESEPEILTPGTTGKKRTRRTKAQIEAERAASSSDVAAKPGIPNSLPGVRGGASTAPGTPDPVTPPVKTAPQVNPQKDPPANPPTPSVPEHAEPRSPNAEPPFEKPKSTEAKTLKPYEHANGDHRRAWMSIINHATGMAFAVWKNNPNIYEIVRVFQADLEGQNIVNVDPKGGVSLAPWVDTKFREALAPALTKKEPETETEPSF